jgi:hypothetical protein
LDGTFASDQEDLSGLDPGTYQLTCTDSNGCQTASFEITVEAIVGVDEWSAGEVLVYPNPTQSTCHIRWELDAEPTLFVIVDATGREVWRSENANITRQITLDVHSWAAGTYTLIMADDKYRIHKKIQVLK